MSEKKWIAWAGGDCPLSRQDDVMVRFRLKKAGTSRIRPAAAFQWRWSKTNPGGDIVAYKIVRKWPRPNKGRREPDQTAAAAAHICDGLEAQSNPPTSRPSA